MPQSLLEWLSVLAVLAAAALWGFRVLVWMVRIHDVGKSAVAEVKQLSGDHELLKRRVEQGEAVTAEQGQQINHIQREMGLA